MSRVEYADPLAPAPSFGVPEAPDPNRTQPRAIRAVRLATIPFAISVVAHLVLFVAYWVPETNRFGPREWWLAQLAPLSSKYLVAGGESLTPLHDNSSGIAAVLLLIFSLLILWMARSRYWVARTWIWAPVLAGAAVCVVTIALLAANDTLRFTWVSVFLMICWVAAAGSAAWLSMLVDVDSLPVKGHRSGLLILIAYAVLGAPPTAVGRFLFAAELRDVAAELQFNSIPSLRTAALALPANLWIYLSGVLAGIVLWLAYQLVPPRRDRRTITLAAALVGSLILLLAFGALVTRPAALQQTERLTTESPVDRLRITCAAWVLDSGAAVEHTVVIDAWDCQRLTTYEGYFQRDLYMIPEALRNVTVRTPEGVPIRSNLIAARYGNILVVATRNAEGNDNRATAVRGLLLPAGVQVWQWSCQVPMDLTLRFAGVPSGDNPDRGYITMAGEGPGVVVGCPTILKQVDPRTGLGRPKR